MTGPSLLQAKSTASSRIVRSGKAETWPPTMMIGVSGAASLIARQVGPGGRHLLGRRRGLMPEDDHADEPRLATRNFLRDALDAPAFGLRIDDLDRVAAIADISARSSGTTAAARPRSAPRRDSDRSSPGRPD